MHRLLPALPLLALVACGPKGKSPSAAGGPGHAINERPAEGGLVVQEVDLDGNGSVEIYNFYRETRDGTRFLVRKELDLNLDGHVDVISHFDDEGNLVKEEMDGDFDGLFDWVDHYQDGQRVLSESDTDYDGKPNVWSYYEGGRIQRKERDTDGDGRIDYWERFDDDGNVIVTGADTDGDGKMDTRDE